MSMKVEKTQAEINFHNRGEEAELKSHYTIVQYDTSVS